MKKERLIVSVIVCMVLMLSFIGSYTPEVVAKTEMPKLISWAVYDIGTNAYIQSGILGEVLQKKFGLRLRAIPILSYMSRIDACRAGIADFVITAAQPAYALMGAQDFKYVEWGPQRLRQVWVCKRQSGFGISVHGNSKIKTIADLKGKSVGYVVGSITVNLATEAYLSYAGLTWNDVNKVNFPSFGSMAKALNQGKIDACPDDTMTAFARELEAMPGGIRWLEIDPENTEACERAKRVFPYFYCVSDKYGAGMSEQNPGSLFSYSFPALLTYESTDEDLVYWQTKLLYEGYDAYKDKNPPRMKWWDIDNCLSTPPYAPFHKGAIKYFKEIGKWTDRLQAINDELIELNLKYEEAWEEALAELDNKGILPNSEDWFNLWEEKRTKIIRPAKILERYFE